MSPPGRSRGPATNSQAPRNNSGKDTHAEANATEPSGAALLTNALEVAVARSHHWEARCPCHDDTEASLIIDVKPSKFWPHKMKVLVYCQVCKASLTMVCDALGLESWRVQDGNERLRCEKPKPSRQPLTDEYVTRCREALAKHDRIAYLTDRRGLSAASVGAYRLGYDEVRDRYTLPVYDASGSLVNVRRYLPDAKPGRKMLNTMGYGTPARLYPSLPPSGPVVVCEGEWDALVLNQYGFQAVTSTHGAATFLPEWVPLFKGRHVAFLYDCDVPGRKCSAEHAAKVATVAKSVRVVDLDPDRDDKWDVSDWFTEGRPPDHLRALINATVPLLPLGVR